MGRYVMPRKPIVYMHSSERMPEVGNGSVRLLVGASVYLGKGVGWDKYGKLYQKVYVEEGLRVTRKDGILLVLQTNAYMGGDFVCRYNHLMNLLEQTDWCLIDEHVWVRCRVNFFQVPFSHVLVFARKGEVSRVKLSKHKGWLQGIWNYPQMKGVGQRNSYPPELCRMILEATTERGDLVLDPFAGTGALLGWAGRMGRRAIGYEIDRDEIPILEGNSCEVVSP